MDLYEDFVFLVAERNLDKLYQFMIKNFVYSTDEELIEILSNFVGLCILHGRLIQENYDEVAVNLILNYYLCEIIQDYNMKSPD